MPQSAPGLRLKEADEQQLRQWVAAFGTPQQVALRGKIVLAAAQGQSDNSIAKSLETNRKTVTLWRARFEQEGLDCLWEVAPGRGRKATYGPGKIKAIVNATLRTKPKGVTPWSCRRMAADQGVSKSTINNIWRNHNLKPHRVKTFKASRDTQFLEKLTDVVGLYLNLPQQAMVFCVDKKSRIQDCTQPGLPLKNGRCGTMRRAYKPNRTAILFAALEVLQERVIGQRYERHRRQALLKFLRCLDQEFPAGIRLHLVLDNYGAHKHPRVQAWLKRHSRFVPHFVPTHSSWLNLVERWFGRLTSRRIRRGSFGSVEDLQRAIKEFLEASSDTPKPFLWTTTVKSIAEKLSRYRPTREKIQPGRTPSRKSKGKK